MNGIEMKAKNGIEKREREREKVQLFKRKIVFVIASIIFG
jgi:hypothetical protein